MGAADFTTYAFGKNAKEAFMKAYDEAVYDHGHDGYNGTISTVGSFQEVQIPKGLTSQEFMDLAWTLNQDYDDKGIEKPPIRRKFKADWDRRQHERDKRLYAKWVKLTPAEQAQVERASRFSKWDLCTAFILPPKEEKKHREDYRLKGKRGHVYCFFGLASC